MVRLLGPRYVLIEGHVRVVPLPKGLEHVPNTNRGDASWLLTGLVSFLVRYTLLVNVPALSTRTT